jgi:hypothetical protein
MLELFFIFGAFRTLWFFVYDIPKMLIKPMFKMMYWFCIAAFYGMKFGIQIMWYIMKGMYYLVSLCFR